MNYCDHDIVISNIWCCMLSHCCLIVKGRAAKAVGDHTVQQQLDDLGWWMEKSKVASEGNGMTFKDSRNTGTSNIMKSTKKLQRQLTCAHVHVICVCVCVCLCVWLCVCSTIGFPFGRIPGNIMGCVSGIVEGIFLIAVSWGHYGEEWYDYAKECKWQGYRAAIVHLYIQYYTMNYSSVLQIKYSMFIFVSICHRSWTFLVLAMTNCVYLRCPSSVAVDEHIKNPQSTLVKIIVG